ncbi:hypothetical protein PYW08_007342 [Mythimna loreyi]|uniref:Uncharacterized protein n=1 Tax=Mythimna loreyi TaxID=667449 RepID=A0ACC2RB80_9NEOP|nr:hypothetical protein PYW08_007342 [Mythimna loreyi]
MERLSIIYEEIKKLCESIGKLGPKRREERLGKQKYEQALVLYNEYKIILKSLDKEEVHTAALSGYSFDLVCEGIEEFTSKILSYKVDFQEGNKMENFELKTASVLIPVMDGKEETTEKIIDGIEMYDSCLKTSDSKKLLISFVLKTRLTKSAKLKLKSEYASVDNLVEDIKTYLLTKKSANSLLSQINNLSQNNMTIAEYGAKLEDLFIGLTIAQADGNAKASAILSPINEKMVIKRFADGLRNRRLSTVISARDYKELKDAVRAAEDEEEARPGTAGQDAVYLSSRGTNRNQYFNNRRGYRSRGYYNHGWSQQHFRGNQVQPRYAVESRGSRGNSFNSRGRSFQRVYIRSNRGKSTNNSNRGTIRVPRRDMYYTSKDDSHKYQESKGEQHDENEEQFFRA